MKTIVGKAIDYQGVNEFYVKEDLVTNTTETASPTPIVIKTGNFKAQIDLTLNVGQTGGVEAGIFIMYVPQGMAPNSYPLISDFVTSHPEWILAWRQLDFGNANAAGTVDTSVIRFGSRLKRNLNTGDKICLFLLGSGAFQGVQDHGIINGRIQYWTCAN